MVVFYCLMLSFNCVWFCLVVLSWILFDLHPWHLVVRRYEVRADCESREQGGCAGHLQEHICLFQVYFAAFSSRFKQGDRAGHLQDHFCLLKFFQVFQVFFGKIFLVFTPIWLFFLTPHLPRYLLIEILVYQEYFIIAALSTYHKNCRCFCVFQISHNAVVTAPNCQYHLMQIERI